MKLFFLLTISVSTIVADNLWCKHEHLHPFESALDYVGETGTLSSAGLQTIITDALYRVSCDTRELGNVTCEACLKSEDIFLGLALDPADGMNEEQFEKTTTYIIYWTFNLESWCPITGQIDWTQMTYDYIVERFVHSFEIVSTQEDDGHDHGYTLEQMERMLANINTTYRAGPDGSTDPPADICWSGNISHFRSGDIYEESALEDPEEGVTDNELGPMNSFILHRLTRGDCIMEDTRAEGYVHPDDYIMDLFGKFAGDDCLMHGDDFDELLEHLDIGHGDDHHDHGGHAPHSVMRKKRSLAPQIQAQIQALGGMDLMADDDHDHAHGGLVKAGESCFEGEMLLASFGLNVSEEPLRREDLVRISPALVQQTAQGCQHVEDFTPEKPSNAQVWGFGFLSVLLISAVAPLGIVVAGFKQKSSYKYIMTVMLGLAVGALAGDALLHLIPHSLGIHSHGVGDGHDHAHDEEEDMEHVWKMLLACCGIWGFFNLQVMLQRYGGGHSHGDHSHDDHEIAVTETYKVKPESQKSDVTDQSNGHANGHANGQAMDLKDEIPQASNSVGLMVAVGDSFHNFADGLAIGASYAYDISLGISTTIAVLVHEVPHEFGIPVAQVEGANQWIYALAAGLFLYVALTDIIPELMEFLKTFRTWSMMAVANIGIFVGFLTMLLIALYEDEISAIVS